MKDYKEFTGKSLDEAMAAACKFYGLERGKLEIEIISDAKSGIFGLVGAKKASIRARKANITPVDLSGGATRDKDAKKTPAKGGKGRREKETAAQAKAKDEASLKPAAPIEGVTSGNNAENANLPAGGAKEQSAVPSAAKSEAAPENISNAKQRQPKAPKATRQSAVNTDAPSSNTESPASGNEPEATEKARPSRNKSARKSSKPGDKNEKRSNSKSRDGAKAERGAKARNEHPRQPRPEKPASTENNEERFPEVPLESIDQAVLEAEVLTVVDSITRHIIGEAGKEFEVASGKVCVRIDSGEDSGLLIGRDGQTLAALQYLASCIVSRRLNASVRVQIDAGDYRNRQMEKLRATALELAARVKENGKPQSTRPMSAYLRRVVHMTLQDDQDVQTHSKGEGSLKRVIIVPKKK